MEQRIRPWLPYVVLAVVWPVAIELLIFVSVFGIGAVGSLLASRSSALTASAVLTPFVCGLVLFAVGRAVGPYGPSRLWIVPVAWAVIVAGPAVAIFGLSDVRDLSGLFGVLGSFVLGAFGFGWGMKSKTAS